MIKGLAFHLLLMFLITACDPFGFGFKKNPAYVLNEAFISISNLDHESFLEVTGKEVLCVYGNPQGLTYLKNNLTINQENIKINPNVLESRHSKSPKFVGYWSYYQERYQVDIEDKVSKALIMKAYVDCDYGTDQEKDDRFVNLSPEKYKKKECRLIKVKPSTFTPLPVPEKCDIMKVNL